MPATVSPQEKELFEKVTMVCNYRESQGLPSLSCYAPWWIDVPLHDGMRTTLYAVYIPTGETIAHSSRHGWERCTYNTRAVEEARQKARKILDSNLEDLKRYCDSQRLTGYLGVEIGPERCHELESFLSERNRETST